jgi:hypothetical protein
MVNFPLTEMYVLRDQEWKIPEKSWNSTSIFYSGQIVENKAGLTERMDWPRKYGEDRDNRDSKVGEQVQNLLKCRRARLQWIFWMNLCPESSSIALGMTGTLLMQSYKFQRPFLSAPIRLSLKL